MRRVALTRKAFKSVNICSYCQQMKASKILHFVYEIVAQASCHILHLFLLMVYFYRREEHFGFFIPAGNKTRDGFCPMALFCSSTLVPSNFPFYSMIELTYLCTSKFLTSQRFIYRFQTSPNPKVTLNSCLLLSTTFFHSRQTIIFLQILK